MLKWCQKAYGISYAALRYFNAAGSDTDAGIGEDHDPETHLIPLVMQTALGVRDNLGIYGDDYPTADGTCIRDFIHVRDLVQAHLLALRYLEDGGESGIFNLGSGDGFSVKQIVDTARRVTGRAIPTRIEPRRAGDPSVLIASNEKASRVLGWKPERALEEIITDAWQWHCYNPEGYGN
jgi:UDP-glucose 4-epimerase